MKKRLRNLFAFTILAAMMVPAVGLAQDPRIPRDAPGEPQELINTIEAVGDWIFAGLMAVVIFIVLWAAFQFLTSGGSTEAVTSARNKLLFAAIGIIIAMFALVFDDIVRGIVGVGEEGGDLTAGQDCTIGAGQCGETPDGDNLTCIQTADDDDPEDAGTCQIQTP